MEEMSYNSDQKHREGNWPGRGEDTWEIEHAHDRSSRERKSGRRNFS